MTDFRALLQALAEARVRFIIVGGAAATAHGSARLTQDVDVVYDRSPENLQRVAAALAPHEPYLRGAPPGLPFSLDEETLAMGLNFTLTSKLGDIDLLGEIVGGGDMATSRLTPWSFGSSGSRASASTSQISSPISASGKPRANRGC